MKGPLRTPSPAGSGWLEMGRYRGWSIDKMPTESNAADLQGGSPDSWHHVIQDAATPGSRHTM